MLLSKTKINIFLLCSVFIIIFSISIFIKPKTSLAANCVVKSATFVPSGEKTGTWYQDADKPSVKVDIVTENCQGKEIEVSITEEDGLGIANDDDLTKSGLDDKPITVTASNHIVMYLKAGEEACEAGAGHDCNYYITVYKLDTSDYSSENKPGGNLVYECDTACLDNWIIKEIYLDVPIGETVTLPANDPVGTNTNYKLLAPLPDGSGDELKYLDTDPAKNDCPFGKYLNIMIKLFFGISGVLAVVMIVMGGIQYMTSELISSKEEGKKSITNAIFGLLLALGSWLILNTLNPDLLNVCLNNLPKETIIISEESVSDVGPGINVGGATVKINKGSAAVCSGGIVAIPSNIGSGKICKDLLNKLIILKSKNPAWRITSTIRDGNAKSSCHYNGSANSGNCADLQINSSSSSEAGYSKENGSPNTGWGDFCVAVAQTGGLNYLNEASKTEKCQNIKNYRAEAYTSGPHLHVNFIGN